MKIAVCVKQVPDTWAEKTLSAEDSTLDRAAADGVLNELDEYAVEEALQLAEALGGEVTVVSMGPERAAETVRKALSMGADAGIHVVDDSLVMPYLIPIFILSTCLLLLTFCSSYTSRLLSLLILSLYIHSIPFLPLSSYSLIFPFSLSSTSPIIS